MKNIKTLGLCSLTVVSALCASAAFAQDSYFYGGVGVGQSRAMVDDGHISDQLRANGTPMTGISVNESDTTFKGFVGYQMNRNIGVEAGYLNLGKSGFTATTANGNYNNERSIDGANLDLVGTLPLTEKWSAQARVGANYANVKDNTTKTGAVRLASGSTSEKSLNLRYGLGVQYEVNPSLFIRAEADLNRVKHTDGSRGNYCNYAISVVIPFGRVAATPVAVVAPVYVPPAPVYVAPAPAPAPVVMVTPPPPPVVVAPAPTPMQMEVAPKRPAKQDRN